MATLNVEVGSYTIIGSPSALQFTLAATTDSYALTGIDATLRGSLNEGLLCDSGVYTLTGSLVQIQRMVAAPAGYTINGTAATLTKSTVKFITAVSGSYTYTGSTTTILQHSIGSLPGIYTLTGTATTLVYSGSGGRILTAVSGSYTYTGSVATLQAEIPMESGDYNVTGTIAFLRPGKRVAANSGTYVVNGQPLTLKQSKRITLAAGTYAITGLLANLNYGSNPFKIINAEGGFYTYTGTTASVLPSLHISLDVGSYVITGTPTGLGIVAFTDLYNLVGVAATFQHLRVLNADSGVYTLTGSDVPIRFPVNLFAADSGTYVLFGFPQAFPKTIGASSGHYSYTGIPAGLFATHIIADTGSYTYTGFPANLTSSHSGRWRKQPSRPPRFTKQVATSSTWEPQPTGPGVP